MQIDGSYLEGGGQILRTSVALSCLLKKAIRVFNIRKGRKQPGLKKQHETAIKVLKEFYNAKVKGLRVGSEEIVFIPRERNIPVYKSIDIGSAGSISLLLQALLPAIIFGDSVVTLDINGGTAGLGAPTIEYTKHVILKNLEKLGVKANMDIIRQGFYPKGGGKVRLRVFQVNEIRSLDATKRGELKSIHGFSVVGSLDKSIAERQANSAKEYLEQYGYDARINIHHEITYSPGTSFTLIAEYENCVIGADALGKKGKAAEQVGKEAAEKLLKAINSNACFDLHMADNILIYLALGKGKSKITVEDVTNHFKTNVYIIERFLGKVFDYNENKKPIKVFANGVGYSYR